MSLIDADRMRFRRKMEVLVHKVTQWEALLTSSEKDAKLSLWTLWPPQPPRNIKVDVVPSADGNAFHALVTWDHPEGFGVLSEMPRTDSVAPIAPPAAPDEHAQVPQLPPSQREFVAGDSTQEAKSGGSHDLPVVQVTEEEAEEDAAPPETRTQVADAAALLPCKFRYVLSLYEEVSYGLTFDQPLMHHYDEVGQTERGAQRAVLSDLKPGRKYRIKVRCLVVARGLAGAFSVVVLCCLRRPTCVARS